MDDASDNGIEICIRVPLDRFSLDVDYLADKRVTGLFGASGSGKTTLLESLAGLRKNARGYIRCGSQLWLDSERGINVPAHRRDIGYVPQEHLLFPHLGVRANLAFAKERAVRNGADFDRVLANVVSVLELEPLLDRAVTDLSGGERQRVALGRALCSGPRLLLLDEPLAALDAKLRLRILPFLKRVRDAFDLPIVIVSHNPTELHALCDEIVALRDGKIIASGRPMDVLMRPDIFGMAESQGFRNILPCRMDGSTGGVSTVRLGTEGNGPVLIVPHCDIPAGKSIYLDVAASEILVSRTRPQGLSARNAVPARVVSTSAIDGMVLLAAQPGENMPVIAVEITADAMAELGIAVGTDLFLIIKSSSLEVSGER